MNPNPNPTGNPIVNLTMRCNDCRAPLLTVWGVAPEQPETEAGMVAWRAHALQAHRASKPECIASGATVQFGWPTAVPE